MSAPRVHPDKVAWYFRNGSDCERDLAADLLDARAVIAVLEKLLLDFAIPYTEKDEKGGMIDSKKWAQTCNAMHAIRLWYLERQRFDAARGKEGK